MTERNYLIKIKILNNESFRLIVAADGPGSALARAISEIRKRTGGKFAEFTMIINLL